MQIGTPSHKDENILSMRTSWEKTRKEGAVITLHNNWYLRKNESLKFLGKRTSGPYNLVQDHVIGTVTIQLRPGLTERINKMQIIPYKQ